MEYISNFGNSEFPANSRIKLASHDRMRRWSDRLNAAMEDRGWNARELARRAKVQYESVAKYTNHKVSQPRGDTVKRLALALDVDPLWLRDGVSRAKEFGVPVVGFVGAGDEISFLDDLTKGDGFDRVPPPAGAPANAVAVIVRGNSMEPMLKDGWVLVYWERREDPTDFISEVCICETADGLVYVKTLRKGLQRGTFTLESTSYPAIENAQLKWAARVEAIYPVARWL